MRSTITNSAFVFLLAGLLLLSSVLATCGESEGKEIQIVDQKKAKATVIHKDNATAQVKAAAAELVRYLGLSTGVTLSMWTDVSVSAPPLLNGNTRILIQTMPRRGDSDPRSFGTSEAFSITFPDERSVVISGETDWGTEFGVYEFLERYVGIRWLMPGVDGEYIPVQDNLSVVIGEVRQQPAFESRLMSGLKGREQDLWARRNRMHAQIKSEHNLYKLFPAERYANSHPEFFPLLDGKRYIPSEGSDQNWQPCLSAPGIVEEAINNICDYFKEHPGEKSYSLGINDSSRYCECDACRAKNDGDRNFLGWPDLSDTYFKWANSVVEGVLKRYPDKWFGCLGYRDIAQAPSRVHLHPRIIPFLTDDRLKWANERFEKVGKTVTKGWGEKSSVLGWYDYLYGTPYLVPRIYFHKMAEYYCYAKEHGVKAIYAEAYPNWGEGPKLYLALKLAWNPDLDVDALLNEWYEKAVGKEAAPYLKVYYDLWEKFWTQKAAKSKWFGTGVEHLNFNDPGYVDLIGEEIKTSRHLLDGALAQAKNDKQKKRAGLLLRAFEYYEASVISLQSKKKCDDPAADLRASHCSLSRKMADKRLALTNEFEKDPVLVHPLRFDQFSRLSW